MVTAVPTPPILGVKFVIVGAPEELLSVKTSVLVADPFELVTVIGPVVAWDGTMTTTCVAVDDSTVARAPLNLTVFWLAVVLNPVP
jgi:hypothetical protein